MSTNSTKLNINYKNYTIDCNNVSECYFCIGLNNVWNYDVIYGTYIINNIIAITKKCDLEELKLMYYIYNNCKTQEETIKYLTASIIKFISIGVFDNYTECANTINSVSYPKINFKDYCGNSTCEECEECYGIYNCYKCHNLTGVKSMRYSIGCGDYAISLYNYETQKFYNPKIRCNGVIIKLSKMEKINLLYNYLKNIILSTKTKISGLEFLQSFGVGYVYKVSDFDILNNNEPKFNFNPLKLLYTDDELKIYSYNNYSFVNIVNDYTVILSIHNVDDVILRPTPEHLIDKKYFRLDKHETVIMKFSDPELVKKLFIVDDIVS